MNQLLKSPRIWHIILYSLSMLLFLNYVFKNGLSNTPYDEATYWDIAKQIRTQGLLHFSNDLRTYFYPLWIAIITLFTGDHVKPAKIIMCIMQYALYLYTIHLVANVVYRYSKQSLVYFVTLGLGLVNPYLVSACTLFLTDISAACFITISLIYLLTSELNKIKNALVIFGLLYISVMIRPSCTIFLPLFFLLGVYRIIKERNYRIIWKLVTAGILSLVIFVPQLYMNVTKFNDWNPLIHQDLYLFQARHAVQMLKYGTYAGPDGAPQLIYNSPFVQPPETTIYQLYWIDSIQFVTLLLSHIYGLFDWGYINIYIYNLSVSHKLIPSIFLYVEWFAMFVGIITLNHKKDRYFLPLALIAVGYAIFMSTTTVESRFGYPIYLILLPFAGYGVHAIVKNFKETYYKRIYGYTFSVFFIFMMFMSYLIDKQTGRIHWF